MKKHNFFFFLFNILYLPIFGQTKLPAFFSDSMILQREILVNVWGKDNPNTNIIVTGSWGQTSSTKTGTDGKWKLQIQTPPAGGPHTLTVQGSSQIIYKGILSGEVWLCAGQSNMEMPMKGYIATLPIQLVDSSEYFISRSNNINLRVFKPAWNPVSRVPLDELTGPAMWKSANPTTTPEISATAYFFARKIEEELGVPIGIIVSARGGSSMESWLDSTTLASVKQVNIPATLNWQTAQSTHTMMYNTFLHPYIGYGIKGMIWSQGEANRANPQDYQALMTKIIESWRQKWNIGAFPFYFAELAARGGTDNMNTVLSREAQLKTMLTVDNTGMASIIDIAPASHDHYPQKKVVGDRLANWALIKTYGKSRIPSGPIFKNLTIAQNIVKLKFNYTGLGLTTNGLTLTDFEVAGVDKIFTPAIASWTDNNTAINLISNSVNKPIYVRYAFRNSVRGNLFNLDGLPAPSFRTDIMQEITPLKFGEVYVEKSNNGRSLTWNTIQEVDVDEYEILRSIDNVNFIKIGSQKAQGSSSSYQYDDNEILSNPIIYYRLKAINNRGLDEFSKTVIISNVILSTFNPSEIDGVSIINPSYGDVVLNFTNTLSGNILITDNLGKMIARKSFYEHKGRLSLILPDGFKGMALVNMTTSMNKKLTKWVIIL